jgi:hypothetical protein
MNSYFDELYAHQGWADAAHWRGFEPHPPALEDKAIRERLLHNSSGAVRIRVDGRYKSRAV